MATIPAYSIVLWNLTPGYAVPGPQFSPAVPGGFKWVVRSAALTNMNTGGGPVAARSIVLAAAGTPIFATPLNATTTGVVYRLEDYRFVVDQLLVLSIDTDDPSWNILVSGFQLSA